MSAPSRFNAWAQANGVFEQIAALEAWQAAIDVAVVDLRKQRKNYRNKGDERNARAIARAITIVQRVARDQRKKGAPV